MNLEKTGNGVMSMTFFWNNVVTVSEVLFQYRKEVHLE